METVSSITPDWSRETPVAFWDPGRKLLRCIREYQQWKQSRGPLAWLVRRVISERYRFWSIVTGAHIPLTCRIGGGLLLPHPNGIVIHPDVIIGVNCLIFQQVTIGSRGHGGVPQVGGHVDIGAGAKVLGHIVIGDHARIGANAVILNNIPPGATAVGHF